MKVCLCDANMYACSNCAGQAVLVRNDTDPTQFYYTSVKPMLDGSGRSIDVCKYPRGGARCNVDTDCGGTGGLCIANRCVCPMGRICGTCTLSETDLLYGASCGNGARDGGAPCASPADCGHGQCLSHPAGDFCLCDPLWVCGRCDTPLSELAKNATACLH